MTTWRFFGAKHPNSVISDRSVIFVKLLQLLFFLKMSEIKSTRTTAFGEAFDIFCQQVSKTSSRGSQPQTSQRNGHKVMVSDFQEFENKFLFCFFLTLKLKYQVKVKANNAKIAFMAFSAKIRSFDCVKNLTSEKEHHLKAKWFNSNTDSPLPHRVSYEIAWGTAEMPTKICMCIYVFKVFLSIRTSFPFICSPPHNFTLFTKMQDVTLTHPEYILFENFIYVNRKTGTDCFKLLTSIRNFALLNVNYLSNVFTLCIKIAQIKEKHFYSSFCAYDHQKQICNYNLKESVLFNLAICSPIHVHFIMVAGRVL
ncbi:hypothetical protein EGR_02299 [Echinococcus granulosus]|uniref:Uncharacterized protein n=1 Tax=Echinococcus granulosus TaxID=6210 RepID=W6UNP4_ECHGR|nr:hypothetical protein EGR_02299 [Echinococcus granulosus]EUB62858.1 hypothetical protein EGR_02299 [Echinococcus granulosus]